MSISIKNMWEFSGRWDISVWLLFGAAVDLMIGSAVMKQHEYVFSSLSRLTLQEWTGTYGMGNLNITWWFYLSILLLFLLAVNTFVCTTNGVIVLLKRFSSMSKQVFFLRFSIHIMHISFILVLAGHLVSHVAGVNLPNNILQKNGTISVCSPNFKVGLKDMKIEFEKETRFKTLEGDVKDVSAILSFADSKMCVQEKLISVNRPAWFEGFSFHLDDFSPKSEGSKREPYIKLTIKKDPGVSLQVAGVAFFSIGLSVYLFSVIRSRFNRDRET
ncbi:MAG: cytochrome c biogenesis protein ResB [Proteobacteria bacterium]|nr:cytochrome c biogenesis protein ResB [Pseudomonadota bacterium]